MSYYTPPAPWSPDSDRYGPPAEPLIPPKWEPEEPLGATEEPIFEDYTEEDALFDIHFECELELENNDDEDDGS